MRTRTAPALATMLLATASIIGLTTNVNAATSKIRSSALDVNRENYINMRIVGGDEIIGSIEGTVSATPEIDSSIYEEESNKRIVNIDDISEIVIADRIASIDEIKNINLIGIADGKLSDGVKENVSVTI